MLEPPALGRVFEIEQAVCRPADHKGSSACRVKRNVIVICRHLLYVLLFCALHGVDVILIILSIDLLEVPSRGIIRISRFHKATAAV